VSATRPDERRPALALSFDFEDWLQLVRRRLGAADWDRRGDALERQMGVVFGLLDGLGARATFFLLGITAERYPHLVDRIAARGDELACHGYAHTPVHVQTAAAFREDVERSVELIERLTGARPRGYRAPAFSINRDTPWAYEILADLGFRYDSSRYDSPRVRRRLRSGPRAPHRLELESGRELWELPLAVWRIRGRAVPVGGGAYWRVLPAPVLARALADIAAASPYPALYFHPYECDPEPLKVPLRGSPAPRERIFAVLKDLQRNPGRRRVVPMIRKIAEQFRFVTYEEACAAVARDN
jgi:polysaccharide deacetylase family protein (PEP-CTERM system associated)